MKIGLLGGSFNPVHVGHLRLAIEAGEALGLDRVELIPAALPPHKSGEPMLPFELRAALCESAVEGVAGLGVNRLEAGFPGPSYTFKTLQALRAARPDDRFTFLLGAGDLRALPKWHRGMDIPALADIGVAGRGQDGLERVRAMVECAWPGARSTGEGSWTLPGGGSICWCDVRRMDVSSSDVRRRWLSGRSIRALVPDCVERGLTARAEAVRTVWADGDNVV